MTPRVLPAARRPKEPSFNLYRPPAVSSTPPEERAFWKWVTTPALGADAGRDAKELLLEEEQRVLSKAASGGGFLVPTDVGEMITAAARAASMIAQVALELETESGETVGSGPSRWDAGSAATWTTRRPRDRLEELRGRRRARRLLPSSWADGWEPSKRRPSRSGRLREALGSCTPRAVHGLNAATGSSTAYKLADLVTVYKALPRPTGRMRPGS